MKFYTRGQVESALLNYLSQGDPAVPEKVFRTRMKRLLEIDSQEAAATGMECAFVTDNPGDQGSERLFRAHDIFILGTGHELLDAGFKQSEVVFLLQHARKGLIREFAKLEKYPNAWRQNVSRENYPDLPADIKDKTLADLRVFFIFEKIDQPDKFRKPVIVSPKICRGLEALAGEIGEASWNRMKLTIVEIANLALFLRNFLENPPEIRRGRPRRKTT